MINILSYLGMNTQSEVCLWTLLGLMRTIFDATLFKVNANLKQVWQMTMPPELSMPVQRALRTMISGVMLVQCFTVYVYLASYIVLLYPVFLEERPTLVLPWLLLAAIRKLLCELTSLALGLGTCVLLGPAKPPCIKFVIVKVVSIMPAFYMWMLIFSYYHALKVASAFKTFPTVLPSTDNDYGLELAVRRRRTKSLQDENQLRQKIVANYYGDGSLSRNNEQISHRSKLEVSSRMVHSTDMSSLDDFNVDIDILQPISTNMTESYEDWLGSEITIPRDTDRILEQFVLMMLRIGAYMKTEGMDSINSQILNTPAAAGRWSNYENLNGPVIPTEETETPPLVGSKGNTASYLLEYPQIFNRTLERNASLLKVVHSQIDSLDSSAIRSQRRAASVSSDDTFSSSYKYTPQNPQIASEMPTTKSKGVSGTNKEKYIETRQQSWTNDAEQVRSKNSSRSAMSSIKSRQSEKNAEQAQSKNSSRSAMSSIRSRESETIKSLKEDTNAETSGSSTNKTRTKENKPPATSESNSSSKSKSDKSRNGK